MPYVDDLIASPEMQSEVFSIDVELNIVTLEIASKMFPGVALNPESQNVAYFPFRLCQSLPTVNLRGRAFTPRVLANSFASLNDQLIDFDHNLIANDIGSHDRIIGHVKATKFTLPRNWKEEDELASLELSDPLPVMGLGALFLRAKGVTDAIENHINKKEKWSTSMECGHLWKDAYFRYENEFIPVKEAEVAMRDCIEPNRILPYRGRKLAACLGGLNGRVDFWGLGLTQTPADPTPGGIINFLSGANKELASRKTLFMPLRAWTNQQLEVANLTADKKIHDLASITIIGETEPAPDGHKHKILSNLLVVPEADANQHQHNHTFTYGGQFSISRGTNPTLTAVTDTHEYSIPETRDGVSTGNYARNVHLHLVKLPLKGKFGSNKDSGTDSNTDSSIDTSLDLADLIGEEMSVKLEDVLKKLSETSANLIKATTDPDRQRLQSEVAALSGQIQTMQSEKNVEADKQAHVDKLIADKKLVKREVADQEITAAVDKAKQDEEKKFKDQLKAQEVKAARIEKLTVAGIDLDTELEGIKNASGKDMTVREKIEAIGIDDDTDFNYNFLMLSNLFKKPEEIPTGETKLAEAANVSRPGTPGGEYAGNSSGNNNGKTTKKLALVGSGSSVSGEVKKGEQANDGGKKIPAHLQGRRRITAPVK